MPHETRFVVTLVGGKEGHETSRVIYDGPSMTFAQHAVSTARCAAVLSGGTLLIVLRKNGAISHRVNIAEGRAI